MLRMAGEVADGVDVHPLGEPGYTEGPVVPNVAAGAAKSRHSLSDIAVIVPVMAIVGDSEEGLHSNPLSSLRGSPSGSRTNRVGTAAQIPDEHIARFATASTWDGLTDALSTKHGAVATRIVLYHALADAERFERYGAVALQGLALAALCLTLIA